MCEQCVAATLGYGEIAPGLFLVKATKDGNEMKAGDYGLVFSNDPFVIFDVEPEEDPTWGLSDEDIEALDAELIFKFHDLADKFSDSLNVHPFYGYSLIKTCQEAGYSFDEHGTSGIAHWLLHKMALLVKEGPKWGGESPFKEV